MNPIQPVHLNGNGAAVSTLHAGLLFLVRNQAGISDNDRRTLEQGLASELRDKVYKKWTAHLVSLWQKQLAERFRLVVNGDVDQATADALNKLLAELGAPTNGSPAKPPIRLLGDDGEPREAFQPGESLVLHVRGLHPSTIHQVTVSDDAGDLFTTSVASNRFGEVDPTVLWPMMGLEDPRGTQRVTVREALTRWNGKTLRLALRDDKKKLVAETKLHLNTELTLPLVLSTDREGYLLNGFEIGKQDAVLSLYNAPAWETARVWMVPSQRDWRPGDAIRPIAATDFRFEGQRDSSVVVAKASTLAPGAYDFIVRNVRYGYEDDDEMFLRPQDLLGGRWFTGLVVREAFLASNVVLGGAINIQDIAGRIKQPLIWPYMKYTNVFQVGEDVWGALDPTVLDPGLISKMVAIYVVPHGTAGSTLQNLAVLGGNPPATQWLTQSWCINANLRRLWPNATQVGEYDVIADFGNNTGSATSFIPDDTFDQSLDIIDGYIDYGFKIVADPTTDTIPGLFAGTYQYDQSTEGTVAVVDDFSTSVTVPLQAVVYFPADAAGATTPGQISTTQTDYPLFVAVHGNSGYTNGYLGYNYLLEHLALNGFIAASIYMPANMHGTGRARVLRRHLQILFNSNQFGAKAANNICIMGHSRGGEAVVIAARLNQQETWNYNINAVISLAPTDQYNHESFSPLWACPYLVIYGSLDGDVKAVGNNGFRLYDRASGMQKSMAFVYGACHDRFNTIWGDGDIPGLGNDIPRVISAQTHQDIAKGYMTAFARQHLRGETQWAGIFRGEWIPAQIHISASDVKIYMQYQDITTRDVDTFEGAHAWKTSTIGGDVTTPIALPAEPQENALNMLDTHSPHDTAGLLVKWDATTQSLRYDIPDNPPGLRDVRNFEAVSFRVTQRVGSASNPAGQPQDFRLTLTDGGGHSRAIRISKLAEIPWPDIRDQDVFTKSAMCTIRVPLRSYTIHCLNVDKVDIADVMSLTFEFAETPAGEIEIDSIQFTN